VQSYQAPVVEEQKYVPSVVTKPIQQDPPYMNIPSMDMKMADNGLANNRAAMDFKLADNGQPKKNVYDYGSSN
jgi:hypothetical protein